MPTAVEPASQPPVVVRHQSALGSWCQVQWRPASLASVVDQIWYFEGRVTQPRERVFPDGTIELIAHLGPRYREVATGGRVFPVACLTGQRLTAEVIEAPSGRTRVLGVRLRAGAARVILGCPLGLVTARTVDLEAVLGATATELVDRCALTRTPAECVRVAARWLADRAALATAADPAVAWVVGEIGRRRGRVSIATLRDRTGWSKSRFTERFRDHVGVPPKRLARIIRSRHAVELIQTTTASLAEVALSAGYADQAHLSREIREHAGRTPTELRAATRYPASASLAETGG